MTSTRLTRAEDDLSQVPPATGDYALVAWIQLGLNRFAELKQTLVRKPQTAGWRICPCTAGCMNSLIEQGAKPTKILLSLCIVLWSPLRDVCLRHDFLTGALYAAPGVTWQESNPSKWIR